MFLYLAVVLSFCTSAVHSVGAAEIAGSVDDTLGHPLADAEVLLSGSPAQVAFKQTRTGSKGRFRFILSASGAFEIEVKARGFASAQKLVNLETSHSKIDIQLTLQAEHALNVPITTASYGQHRNAMSATGASSYRFDQTAIHELPAGSNSEMSEVLEQAPGVSQDAYGQGQGDIHIHGENGGGIQYRLDGVFLPDAVSEFGELFSPRFTRSITLLTGVLPAEMSYRTEGVIDIRTKNGCSDGGASNNNVEFWGGQHDTVEPSFEYGGCAGSLGYYFGGSYLQSRLGLQSPSPSSTPHHDLTRQGQLFGAVNLALAQHTTLTLLMGLAENYFEIPPTPNLSPLYSLDHVANYPSSQVNESEQEQNYYELLLLHGRLTNTIDYQIAAFDRYYALNYAPDPVGDLIYNGIAPRLSHSGWLNGLQADATDYLNQQHTLQGGFYVSGESIELDDQALTFPATDGKQTSSIPITIIDNHNSFVWLGGLYLEDEWRPIERLTIYGGLRWDAMSASVTESQLSPRFSIVYDLTRTTVIHGGYARYFKTPPFESLALGTVRAFQDTTAASPTAYGNDRVPAERDDYLTAGIRQKVKHFNIGIDGFGQLAHDQLDLAQFAGTPLVSPLSYRHGRAWGADLTLDYREPNLSAYLNFSYAILQARDIIAGQYLADSADEIAYIANHWIFLDDSQEFTGSGGIAYRIWGVLLSVDGIWGSGYRRGFANTGELPPILQFNCAVEHGFDLPKLGSVAARLTVINLFDHVYQIRNGTGIGVSSPQYGPRRSFYGSLKIPLPD